MCWYALEGCVVINSAVGLLHQDKADSLSTMLSIMDDSRVRTGLPWELNILQPQQNGRHFSDDVFICISMKENVSILSKFVTKGPMNNKPVLVQIMFWYLREVTSYYLNQSWLYMRRSASESQMLLTIWLIIELGYLNYSFRGHLL